MVGAALLMPGATLLLMTQLRTLINGCTLPESGLRHLRGPILAEPHVDAVNDLAAVYLGASKILVDADLDLAEDLDTVQIELVLDAVESRVRAIEPETERVRVLLNSPVRPASSTDSRT